jgi:NADH:ubiquinone oxidoreductase subunit 2 (subunit N)
MKHVAKPLSQFAEWTSQIPNTFRRREKDVESAARASSFRLFVFLAPLLAFLGQGLQGPLHFWLSSFFIVVSIVLSISAMSNRHSPTRVLHLITVGQFLAASALSVQGFHSEKPLLLFVVGTIASWLLVFDVYRYVLARREIQYFDKFSGLFAQFPLASGVALIGVLGIIGFPIASTFFAEDLLLEHAVKARLSYIPLFSAIFIINGITMVRMFARIFFGARDNTVDIDLDFSARQAATRVSLFFLANALALSI